MLELISEMMKNKDRAVAFAVITLGFAAVVGRYKLDNVEADIAQIKTDNAKILELIHKNETTWAKIAERVKIYHKE